MAEVAALGLRVDGAEGIEKASDSLDNLTKSSAGAEVAATKLGKSLSTTGRESTSAGSKLVKAGRDAANSSSNVDKLKTSLDSTSKSFSSIGAIATGTFLGVSIASVIGKVVTETRNAEQEQAQLAATLQSTGNAAGYTQEQLNDMAQAMSHASTLSGGEINQAQTTLLAFTNIVGDQFTDALQAAIDMSARTGMSVVSAAETIGRALDVPSQGLSALSRQGFRFTDEQKKLAEQLESTGKTAQAQGIVLGALKESYGGAAQAARDTFGGAITGLQNTLSDLMTGGDGSLDGATDAVNDLASTLQSEEVKKAFADFVSLITDTIKELARLTADFAAAARAADGFIGVLGAFSPSSGNISSLWKSTSENIAVAQKELADLSAMQDRLNNGAAKWNDYGQASLDIAKKNAQVRLDYYQRIQNRQESDVFASYLNVGETGGSGVTTLPTTRVTGASPTKPGKQSAAQKEAARAAQENARAIDELTKSLYLAGLQGEQLAVVQARMSLNNYATPAQIEQIQELSRALYQVQEQEALRKKFGEGKDADQFILGNTSPLSGGAFDDQLARYEAEAEAERERYQGQLDRLTEARQLQIATNQSYDDLEYQAAEQHAQRMGQIDQARNSLLLTSASEAFGSIAQIMRQSQGEQSGIYRAMFAASKAFAIANASMNAYDAISKAWASAPFPANLAAVAATAPQVMALVSSISGIGLSGMAHDGIDSVPATGTWLLEKGERVTTSKTSARLDSVLERIDARQRGGQQMGYQESKPPVVNVIEDPSRAGEVQTVRDPDGQYSTSVFVRSIFSRGEEAQALEAAYGLRRVGR